ncbi:MAG: efflux RND transporter permease subunit [Planctomycetes bacterium]|nr:efflux RND transporter permease subunit [Planctomycetota bacterium]
MKSVGDYVLALPARKETGANVMTAMANLKEQIRYCNESILSAQGRSLALTQVYDETTYIKSAIRLVTNNLLVGGALAIVVLIVFLRSASATGIVAFSIPISVIGTFLAVAALGRNLNVVMLAGMAFSVGMVVDNAIVVLENIYRHRQLGKSAVQATLDGTREVWGAVLASTLTTMAVFLPVVFIEEEAGQLFRDIAIAICCAVGLSLVVATTVIPALASRTLKVSRRLAGAGAHTGRVAALVSGAVGFINRSWIARLTLIVFLVSASIGGSRTLMPDTDYLPSGNRNLVFGFVVTPPGYNIEAFKNIARTIESGSPDDPVGLSDYWNAEVGSPAEAALPPVTMHVGEGKETVEKIVPAPPIENFFFVAWNGGCFMGATSKHESRVKPLIEILNHAGRRVPGTMTFFSQSSLFGRLGAGNSIQLEIRGDQLDEVTAAASALLMPVMEKFDFPRPSPTNFALGRPEVRIIPDREKAANLGLDVRDIGFMVAACVDGAYVGNFYDRGDEIDLRIHVRDTEQATIQEIGNIPIHAPGTGQVATASAVGARIVPLSSAVKFVSTTAPQQINHIEEMPAVTLTVNPPEGMALETAMGILEDDIIAPLRQTGAIPSSVITTLAGTADKLVQTREALFGSWKGNTWAVDPETGQRPLVASLTNLFTSGGFLALLISYLLMAALFESFVWPFVIIFTVPLATVGGFVGLRIVHEISRRDPVSPIQQLDTLTMLGFVILIGVVVNNGILLVHQALNHQRDHGLAWPEAITESVRTRVRPIFMTAFTSIGGMLPLVFWPGSGSELYRGLGSVVVGGLLVATVFTLFLVPAVLSVAVDLGELLRRLLGRQPAESSIPVQSEPDGTTAPGG